MTTADGIRMTAPGVLTFPMAGLVPAECRRVGVILSGGNVDPAVLGRLWT